MKKTSKILASILMLVMVLTVFTATSVSASTKVDSEGVISTITGGGTVDTSKVEGFGANVVDIITTIGIIVAVVVLLVLGIKYMMGSASEKAEYKKTMIPYLIGAIIIFGASAIAKAVVAMANSIT